MVHKEFAIVIYVSMIEHAHMVSCAFESDNSLGRILVLTRRVSEMLFGVAKGQGFKLSCLCDCG